MQRLYVESDLPVDAATAWQLFDSPTFRERLDARARLHTEVVDEHSEGAVVRRTLRIRSLKELPGIAARALGTRYLTYDMSTRFDPARSRLEWSVRLPVLTDRVSVSGATRIEDRPHGSCRIVEGEVEIRLPVIGGRCERIVVSEFQRSMGAASTVARELILEARGDRQGPAAPSPAGARSGGSEA